jgi:branched-chain amino acid aminotransferase
MVESDDVWINVNGEFERGTDAKVSVMDRSFAYGDGVFEGVSVLDDTVLLLDEHVDRLYRSAKRIGIDIDHPKSEIRDRVVETVRRNDMSAGYVRPLVSRGVGPYGIGAVDEVDGPDVYIIPRPGRSPHYDDPQPVTARLASTRQPSPDSLDPKVKANNYMSNILAELETRGTDADTTVVLNSQGYVTEAAAANIYVVRDGLLMTPPETDILVGTTRNALLDVAESSDVVETDVRNLVPYDLLTADECFVTNSLMGITPVTRINDTDVGNGEVGSVTDALGEAFRDHLLDTGTPVP